MSKIIRLLGLSAMLASSLCIAEPGDTLTATSSATASVFNPAWQSSDVNSAWNSGYKGQGVTITVVDDFTNNSRFSGRLIANTIQTQGHGYWTSEEAGLIAPSATIKAVQFGSGAPIALASGLNVINASYGLVATYGLTNVRLGGTETSMVNLAKNGQAVVVKAAGNDSVNMLSKTATGQQDYLAVSLKGAQSALYVGALTSNGSTTAKSTLASYSNKAGTDVAIQSHFLVAGVNSNVTGLAGTSFAAPVVSGYAAIIGSKFKTASATAVTNQLLNTARTDTINGYNASIHGRGEASLTRAIAPVAIR